MPSKLLAALSNTKTTVTDNSRPEYDSAVYCDVKTAVTLTGYSEPRIRQLGDEGLLGTKKYGVKKVYYELSRVRMLSKHARSRNAGKAELNMKRAARRMVEASGTMIDLLKSDIGLSKVDVDTTVKTLTLVFKMAQEALDEVEKK